MRQTRHPNGRSLCRPGMPLCPSRGQKRLQSLLDVALALFAEQGIEATTVDDIVARAGVAKGTFYHHFESKAALLQALRESFINDFSARIADAVAQRAPDDWMG